jgi:hypothetical protein
VTETKKRLQQKYGEVAAFSRFLRTRAHPNGEPLLEWRDDNFTELRLTVLTKAALRAPCASNLNTAVTPWGLPPRTNDSQERPSLKPKKTRHATTTTPLPISTPEEDLPPPIKASLIKIFCNLWVPDFDPKTAKNLRHAVENATCSSQRTFTSPLRGRWRYATTRPPNCTVNEVIVANHLPK